MCSGTAERVERLLKERSATNDLLRRRSAAKGARAEDPPPTDDLDRATDPPASAREEPRR